MSVGVSNRIKIGGESFRHVSSFMLSRIDNSCLVVDPPVPSSDGTPSEAMYAYQNRYRDFVFEKITPPDYGESGSVSSLLGIPLNRPDFVSDFHYIGMMRSIDDMIRHRYKGTITGKYDTPGSGM